MRRPGAEVQMVGMIPGMIVIMGMIMNVPGTVGPDMFMRTR
jgi:hypothetical protein